MNYEEMSDFEINKIVTLALFDGSESPVITKAFPSTGGSLSISGTARVIFSDGSVTTLNFCNNPNDAWPIITENKISTSPTGDLWICGSSSFGTQTIDKNPLRAACICFLKMKDAEK